MLKGIKAVLFDLDGTLINTIDDLSDATNFALKLGGYPTHTAVEYKMMVGNGMRKLVERALPENHRDDETVDKTLDVFMEYYNAHSVDKTKPYDGARELVDKLSEIGIITAVVTNKAEPSAKAILAQLYPGCFDLIIGQRPELPSKPDPAAAHLAMKQLNVTPEECIFMGDSGVDVQTAVNSGAYPVGVLWGFRDEDELRANGAKVVISKPEELLNLIF